MDYLKKAQDFVASDNGQKALNSFVDPLPIDVLHRD